MIKTPDRAPTEEVPVAYAVHIRNQDQVKVKSALRVRGVEILVIRNTVYNLRQDRFKLLEVPLFSCYLFVFTKMNQEACNIKRSSHV